MSEEIYQIGIFAEEDLGECFRIADLDTVKGMEGVFKIGGSQEQRGEGGNGQGSIGFPMGFFGPDGMTVFEGNGKDFVVLGQLGIQNLQNSGAASTVAGQFQRGLHLNDSNRTQHLPLDLYGAQSQFPGQVQ